MEYKEWVGILQNKLVEELDPVHAKMLYEQDMFRAEKVQTAAKARAGRSGRAGGGVRKRKVVAAEAVTYYWTPDLIPSCSLWLDADDASSMTIDGSNKISEWRNKSTEFTGLFDYGQSLGTKQPLLVASEVNGKPVVRFDGSDDRLEGSGSLTHYSPAATNDELTAFYVLKYYPSVPADNVGAYIGLNWGLDNGYSLTNVYINIICDIALTYALGLRMFSVGAGDGTVGFTTDPLIYSVVNESGGDIFLTGSDINASYNGLPDAKAYPASSGDRYSLLGGKAYTYDKNFPGDIAEVICYARNLSAAERTTVETYLQNKWDITVATQSVDPVLGSDNSYTP
jgi:hypothetical protein